MAIYELVGPQCHRFHGEVGPACPPSCREDWEVLRELPQTALRELGLKPWCDPAEDDWPHEQTLMLFPGEWYSHIPEGYDVVGLHGERYEFERHISDDDIRFGCLPYGILAAEV